MDNRIISILKRAPKRGIWLKDLAEKLNIPRPLLNYYLFGMNKHGKLVGGSVSSISIGRIHRTKLVFQSSGTVDLSISMTTTSLQKTRSHKVQQTFMLGDMVKRSRTSHSSLLSFVKQQFIKNSINILLKTTILNDGKRCAKKQPLSHSLRRFDHP